MADLDIQTLAKAAKRRREQLTLTQQDVSDRGGPGVVLVGRIERAQEPNPRGMTLTRLSRALQWPDLLAQQILEGGDAQDRALAVAFDPVPVGPDLQDLSFVALPDPSGGDPADRPVTERRLAEEMTRVFEALDRIEKKLLTDDS